MFLLLLGNSPQFEAYLTQKNIHFEQINQLEQNVNLSDYNAIVLLNQNISTSQQHILKTFTGLVLWNSLIQTLTDAAQNQWYRFTALPEFLTHPVWEYATHSTNAKLLETLTQLGQALAIQWQKVADAPGFVKSRTIAMMVHEANLMHAQNIASPQDMDTGMKLGTAHPKGPFEWQTLIGAETISQLIQKLAAKSSNTPNRYTT
jgi:hypothetical protein